MLTLCNRQRVRRLNLPLLRRLIRELLFDYEELSADLGVFFVASDEIARLNERYLAHAGSTDVITFDYAEPGDRTHLHGEVFICVEEAVIQAKRYRTTCQAEVVRYIIHGVLHLLGFDDSVPAARHRMKVEEDRALARLGRKFKL